MSKKAIPVPDTKILWARSAGICANPECKKDLTEIVSDDKPFLIGEMAHIVAESEDGPRGQKGGGDNTYENLILLCPTCHKTIDKSPEDYSLEMLLRWKADHEDSIRTKGSAVSFGSFDELKRETGFLLAENNELWQTFGPKSEAAQKDPASNLNEVWEARKLDKVIPNNWQIINLVESNKKLLSADDFKVFMKFKSHAVAFERNQYKRLDDYPVFPVEFSERFGG